MRFTLDGVPAQADGDANAPLLYLLRGPCDNSSARFGCGTGNCGACIVMIDGRAEPSCTTPNWFAADKQVRTAAGLADDPVGAVVLQAFKDAQAAQCGYCINGMLVSLTALLTRTPDASADALVACLDRHLCRCGTHLRILRAARLAVARLAASPAASTAGGAAGGAAVNPAVDPEVDPAVGPAAAPA